MRPILNALLTMSVLSGCSSITSDLVSRDGVAVHKGADFDGVPIVLSIPDRQAFLVTESTYSMPDGTTKVVRDVDKTPIPLPSVEVFTVDMKQPPAGTAKNKIWLADQYPQAIDLDINNQTIEKLPALIGALADLLPETREADAAKDETPPDFSTSSKFMLRTAIQSEGGIETSRRQYLLVFDSRTGTFSIEPMAVSARVIVQ